MKTSLESLKQHDYNQKVQKLMRKGAELKKRSLQLNAQLQATFKQCDQLLHPEREQNNKTDNNK